MCLLSCTQQRRARRAYRTDTVTDTPAAVPELQMFGHDGSYSVGMRHCQAQARLQAHARLGTCASKHSLQRSRSALLMRNALQSHIVIVSHGSVRGCADVIYAAVYG